MFNWVCPRCGRDNSPSYTECPDCKERDLKAQEEAAALQPQPAVPEPYYQAPAPPPTQEWQVPYQAPPQPTYAPPQQPAYGAPPQQPGYNPPPQYVQVPPQYAPQQPQYQQPPQYPQQPPPQYAPPQQYPQPGQQAPQQPPTYPPQYPPQYPQSQPVYTQQPPPQYQPAPQPPQYQPPQQQYAPPVPKPAPAPTPAPAPKPVAAPVPAPKPVYVPPPEEPGFGARLAELPTVVLMLLFAVIFLLVIAGGYYGYQKFFKGGPATVAEKAATPAKTKVTNPMQKYIEVVGIRLTTDAKKNPVAKFVVVNHASTEVNGLSAIVTLWASTSRSEEDGIGSFAFNLDSVGPYNSKELSAPFKTKLKIYELPDWQNATPEIQITSPQP
jgi:hypothetical protein